MVRVVKEEMFLRIKEFMSSNDWKLISEEYVNSKEELELVCPEGHKVISYWNAIQKRGLACKECNPRWSTKGVQEYLNVNLFGFTLTSKYSTNTITLECPNNHIFNTRWSRFLNNKHKCRECAKENKKLSFTKAIEEEGYRIIKWLSDARVTIKCNRGHEEYQTLTRNFTTGKRCYDCSREDLSYDIDYVKNCIEIESIRKYTLLSKTYVNGGTPLEILCDRGHIFLARFNVFHQKDTKCPECVAIDNKFSYDFVKSTIESIEYELLSDTYVNVSSKLLLRCNGNHDIEMRFACIRRGQRCRECYEENNSGKNNPNWKGGISTLNTFLRGRIYHWRELSINSTNHRCDITGVQYQLEVHHKYPFHFTVSETLAELNLDIKENIKDYSESELEDMTLLFQKKHIEILGVPLTKSVHDLYHKLFGFNGGIKEYEFFKDNYEDFKSGKLIVDNIGAA